MDELNGKTLILTGASSGIGRALAVELARRGVSLVLNARRASEIEEAASECSQFGVAVGSVAGDAGDLATVSRLVGSALEIGRFHGFIQAAGVLHPGPFLWELPEAAFEEIFAASVIASYRLIRAAVPELRRQNAGLAVFVGSGASEMHIRGIGAYASSKAAVEHLALQLAVEAPEITSFIYRPGMVDTRMQEEARQAGGGAGEELQNRFRRYKEAGELITPEVSAKALVRILMNKPSRFHGGIATWRDGMW